MRKENKKGITLISLVITVVVLLILVSISTYSGIATVEHAKFTNFTAKMKIMQLQINAIYEKYKNGDIISISGHIYTGKDILSIERDVTNEVIAKKDKIFDELREDPESEIYENEKANYKFWSNELIKDLGIDGVEGSFFVNVEKRNFISYEGIKYNGKTYYTLHQLPDSLYNVEYENANTDTPSFDIKVEETKEKSWKISVSNIQYNGYINKWYVKYKLDKQDYWKTSNALSFIVDEKGAYSVKVVNGNIESELKQINASEIGKLKETKKILEENTYVVSDDNVKVTIPAEFTISEESPNNAKEGIIITDSIDESTGKSNGNEFVWIPVDSDLKVVGTNKFMAKESTAEGYRGENGKTNYEGVLYDFKETDSTEMEKYGQGVLENEVRVNREPDSNNVYDGVTTGSMQFLSNLQQWLPEEEERYKDYDTFMKTLQEDYNEMIDSVKTYGGFYVGRFEMGAEDVIESLMPSGKPTSKKGAVTNALNWFVSRQWYGLYSKAKTYTNKKNSVKSSMIWGSQYDAMLNYALTGDDKEKVTATGNGHYGKTAVDTGTTPTDKILNIFDLEGNHAEWTLEANRAEFRVGRGSYYSNTTDFSPSSRIDMFCDSTLEWHATRLTLYIKNPTEN